MSHDKMTHLANICVVMNKLMEIMFENIDLISVICEHCSKLSGKTSKAKCEKHQSVLKQPMNFRIFLQILEYSGGRYEHCKKTFPSITKLHVFFR